MAFWTEWAAFNGSDECFVQLGEGLFGGIPRCKGYGEWNALKRGKNFVWRDWT